MRLSLGVVFIEVLFKYIILFDELKEEIVHRVNGGYYRQTRYIVKQISFCSACGPSPWHMRKHWSTKTVKYDLGTCFLVTIAADRLKILPRSSSVIAQSRYLPKQCINVLGPLLQSDTLVSPTFHDLSPVGNHQVLSDPAISDDLNHCNVTC
jgi:hypothetical protein